MRKARLARGNIVIRQTGKAWLVAGGLLVAGACLASLTGLLVWTAFVVMPVGLLMAYYGVWSWRRLAPFRRMAFHFPDAPPATDEPWPVTLEFVASRDLTLRRLQSFVSAHDPIKGDPFGDGLSLAGMKDHIEGRRFEAGRRHVLHVEVDGFRAPEPPIYACLSFLLLHEGGQFFERFLVPEGPTGGGTDSGARGEMGRPGPEPAQ